MTFSTVENITAEYKAEHKPNQFQLSDDKLIPIIESLISDHKDYERSITSQISSDPNKM